MEGGIFSHRKIVSVTDSVSKNSPAESLMALGVIADTRGRGILEFAQVAERERGPTDWRDLESAQEVDAVEGQVRGQQAGSTTQGSAPTSK